LAVTPVRTPLHRPTALNHPIFNSPVDEHLRILAVVCGSRRETTTALLDGIIKHDEDHIVLLDLGLADKVIPRVISLGKTDFTPIEHEPVIV